MSEISNFNFKEKITEEEKTIIMKSIETKTEERVKLATISGEIVNPINLLLGKPVTNQNVESSIVILQNIMQSGANEFENKVGRPMTYSEMREMYG